MLVRKVFDGFILSRRLSGLSKKSIKNYHDFIEPFILYLGEDLEYKQINQDVINGYIIRLLDKDISKATLATYIRHVKIFLRWADTEYSGNYSIKAIKVPKTPKKNVHVYTDDEIREIFDSVGSEIPWITARNHAIIALMLDSGLRQAEVCTLQQKKIYLKEQYMTVTGKGNKERTVPIGRMTSKCLERYYEMCPYKNQAVFVSRDGEPLSCNAIKLMISKLSKKVPFELSSHKLRHNFATNYCLDQYERYGQIDINKLMYLMGHEDSKTTQRYLHFAYEIIATKGCISHIDNIFKMNV